MANLPKEVYLTICMEPKEIEEDEELPEEEEEDEEAAEAQEGEDPYAEAGAEGEEGEEGEEAEPKAEGQVTYSREFEEKEPIEIEVTATTLIGDVKDRLNAILGKLAGFDAEEIDELPRMALMTGKRVWSDLEVLKTVILETGCLSDLKYGTITVVLQSVDLRDPPKRSKEEEENEKRIQEAKETAARERSRTRRVRPTKRSTDSFATTTTDQVGQPPRTSARTSGRTSGREAK